MSIISEIFEALWDTTINYGGLPVNLLGIPRFDKYKKRSFKATVNRLNKKGLIQKKSEGWILSKDGMKFVEEKNKDLKDFLIKFPKNSPKNLIVMFDIPESRKKEREWFRWHLKQGQYLMIQQSVWVGPSPLPKKFIEYLKEIKLENNIKTFKLAKPYNSKMGSLSKNNT